MGTHKKPDLSPASKATSAVGKLMGHSDVETTMIYAHLAPEHLTKAISKLPFSRH